MDGSNASQQCSVLKNGLDMEKLEISATIKVDRALVQWSFCGSYVAIASENCLCVRDEQTLQIIQQYTANDVIQSIAWSTNSVLIAAASFKRGILQLWSIKDPSWTCKISEGIAGLTSFIWLPDSIHVLTVSDFQLYATLWSLRDRSKKVIRHPKLSASDGFASSPDGKLLAVIERSHCKDYLGIYDSEKWELHSHFALESYDCVQVNWAPDNCAIAIADNTLEYRVLFYTAEGTLLSKYEAYKDALGYDDHLRILNSLTWQPVADIAHDVIATQLNRCTKHAVEFEEQYMHQKVLDRPQGRRVTITKSTGKTEHSTTLLSTAAMLAASSAAQAIRDSNMTGRQPDICFVTRKPPFSVMVVASDPAIEIPLMGIQRAIWSADSRYIATKSELMPHNIWIWNVPDVTLAIVLTLLQPVRSFQWHTELTTLAIVTGGRRVYLWSADSAISWIDIPFGQSATLSSNRIISHDLYKQTILERSDYGGTPRIRP
ncbi:unnamed protein product [Albugo candida]|uniref:Uncharacterized protein n=1 Tax=Albugo candida TaxID=65357 RepID=A0A024GC00_9STRA|nr:unnamed protein product [Albugo candida]|eukprot:CCI44373.1 unnamed protein product [Albugo candida]